MRLLAVIPARGGSKRLPGKNLRYFGGRPLLAWSIALAARLNEVNRVVVSTDSLEIAAVARDFGASIIIRPPELATDDSATLDVLIHALELQMLEGKIYDGILLLQPTNPLRPIKMIEEAISRFINEPCDSLISVSGRPLKIGNLSGGQFKPIYKVGEQSRLLANIYYENGLFYLIKTKTILQRRTLLGDIVLGFVTKRPYDEVDIDEAMDHSIGEAILQIVREELEY